MITKSDYRDGNRGYYARIPQAEIDKALEADGFGVLLGLELKAIREIFEEAINDLYWVEKFYIRFLKGGGISINGVGWDMKSSSEVAKVTEGQRGVKGG